MATEVTRCTECGTVFKGVPHWLTTAKVTFTCTSCPKKGTRNLTRFEPPADIRAASVDLDSDADPDGDVVDIEDLDDAEIDLGDEDLEVGADEI